MGEFFPGAIQIGGAVPRRLAPDLAQAITEVGALAEAEAAPAIFATAEDLHAAVDPVSGVIRLYDHDASYGAFSSLEDWLREHGIAYDRQSDARYEYDGEAVFFRSGPGLRTFHATQDGAPTVCLDRLTPVRTLLRDALAERSPEKVRAALAELDEALGPDVPPLAPFTFTD